MSKHLTCDGPQCSRGSGYPIIRWLTLSEYTDVPAQRSMKGSRHFCGATCLRGWLVDPTESRDAA